ncbi:MAG: hypothetical protein PHW07_09055 [Sulfurospirillaceae bacterium]|nr:hypothetical protein [Sulfurospirillaceae bacterium]
MGVDFADILNQYGKEKKSVFFAIDYTCKEWIIAEPDPLKQDILYQIGTVKNYKNDIKKKEFVFKKSISLLSVI